VIWYLAHILRAIDAVERAEWRRLAAIVAGLGTVDPRRFMYGRD